MDSVKPVQLHPPIIPGGKLELLHTIPGGKLKLQLLEIIPITMIMTMMMKGLAVQAVA